jgi:PAS domain S-box-containing protein
MFRQEINKRLTMQKKMKKPLLKKISHNNLEGQIRLLTNNLNIIKRQLERGVDRAKLAKERFRGEVSQGVDREQLGADREKLAEEQIHIRTKAMESTFDGIFIIDAQKLEFPIIYANPSFYQLTGFSKNEVIGKNYFLLYGGLENSLLKEEIKQTLLQGKSFQGEMIHFKKNGEKFWSLLRITLVRDKNGIVTHYVGNKTDTTLMKQRNLEIEVQREELLHVTRVGKLAEFVSSLAHEISQPLTAILSYAQAAQRMYKDKEPQLQEILQYIINDDQRAAEVIRRLRYLLKKSKPTFEQLDINDLINDTITLMMPHITAKNKVIKFEPGSELPSVQGDQIQLQQVLLNLISNSLEAMESNNDSRELMISTSLKNKDSVMVKVKDTGCGILEENIPKLFRHFFTSKPDGLGMGLSISRSIVEAHGGHLEGKNSPEGGATFYFTIPVHIKSDA